jgi:hypothetical protein
VATRFHTHAHLGCCCQSTVELLGFFTRRSSRFIESTADNLIFEIWMCCFYHTSNASISSRPRNTPPWGHKTLHLPERSRLLQRDDAPGLFRQICRLDCEAAKQQGRYAIGRGLSRCTHRRKVAARFSVLIVQIIHRPNPAIALTSAQPCWQVPAR